MSDWLEIELAERMAPVEAPDELWCRIAEGPRRRPTFLRLAAPVTAVLTLILGGALWYIARGPQPSTNFRQFPPSVRAEDCQLCHTTL